MAAEILVEISGGQNEQESFSSRSGDPTPGTEEEGGIEGAELVLWSFRRGVGSTSEWLANPWNPLGTRST